MSRRRKLQLAVVLAALAAAGGTAFAAVKATTFVSGAQIGDVVVMTQNTPSSTSSPTFVNVPGASATLDLSDGDAIRARFSGDSLCGGEVVGQTCAMRVVIVGKGAADPKAGLDFAFDSVDTDTCCTDATAEAHSMEWVSRPFLAGSYTVRAQYAVQSDDDMSFTVNHWTFSAEKIEFGGGD